MLFRSNYNNTSDPFSTFSSNVPVYGTQYSGGGGVDFDYSSTTYQYFRLIVVKTNSGTNDASRYAVIGEIMIKNYTNTGTYHTIPASDYHFSTTIDNLNNNIINYANASTVLNPQGIGGVNGLSEARPFVIGYEFTNPQTFSSYRMWGVTSSGDRRDNNIGKWKVYGSSSKSAYENGTRTLLHDQSTQLTASDWTNPYQYPPSGSSTKYADDYLSEASVYTLTTTGSFSYYVIEASATSGNTTYCGLGELEFFGDVIATNDRLIKGLRMDLSTDGTNWTTVKSLTNLSGTSLTGTTPVSANCIADSGVINHQNINYNYVRFVITEGFPATSNYPSTPFNVGIGQIQVLNSPPSQVGNEPEILKDVPFIAFVNKGNRKGLRIPTPMIFEKFGISKSLNDIPRSCITSVQKEGRTENDFYNTGTTLDKYVTYCNIGSPLSNFNFTEDLGKITLNYLHNPIYSGQTQPNYNDCVSVNPQPEANPTANNQEQRLFFSDGVFKLQDGVGQAISDDRNLSSSQSGIGILDVWVGVNTGNEYIKVQRSNEKVIYPYSLLNKIGYDYEQLIAPYKNVSISYSRNHQVKYLNDDNMEKNKYENMLYPLTTNGLISAGNNIGLTINQQGFPLFLLGNPLFRQTSIAQTPDFIVPESFPIKSSYPYLLVRSNIIEGNKNFISGNGYSQNIIGVINKAYDSNDYFYSFANDWSYTIDKPYILSDISVEILTPNNLLPAPIDENSSIIFKITKNKMLYNEHNVDKKDD